MNNNITSEILRNYEKQRDLVEKSYLEKKNYIYKKIPEIQSIDSKIAKISMEASKKIFYNPESADSIISQAEQESNKLLSKRAFLLTQNNIPLNYLKKEYRCTNCEDTGFVDNKKCGCFKQQIINYSYKMSNLANILKKENFSTFNIDLFSDIKPQTEQLSPKDNMKKILTVCEGFCLNFNKTEQNLLFYGETGLGKTFLCNSISKALLDKGYVVVYQTSFNILELLENHKFRRNQSEDYEFGYNMLFESDLLVIDDLGTEMTNSFSNSEIFNIINTRLLNSKKTIISTNLSPYEIRETYSDRFASRIFGMFTILKFYGHDLRWEPK